MMHYCKAENVEQELNIDNLPFEDCMPKQKDFLWMQVKGGTKVKNVVEHAKSALKTGKYRSIVWSGSGGAIVKTISCAEILKQNQTLYQVTRMGYTNVEEHWKPQMDGLEEIIVKRRIPTLYILMSKDELSASIESLQTPNTSTVFWKDNDKHQQTLQPASKKHPSFGLKISSQNVYQRKQNKQK